MKREDGGAKRVLLPQPGLPAEALLIHKAHVGAPGFLARFVRAGAGITISSTVPPAPSIFARAPAENLCARTCRDRSRSPSPRILIRPLAADCFRMPDPTSASAFTCVDGSNT